MLLERRELQAVFRNTPDLLKSVHLFTDGSPIIGQELQGMILQLALNTGEIRTLVLPGVTIHYGGNSVLD